MHKTYANWYKRVIGKKNEDGFVKFHMNLEGLDGILQDRGKAIAILIGIVSAITDESDLNDSLENWNIIWNSVFGSKKNQCLVFLNDSDLFYLTQDGLTEKSLFRSSPEFQLPYPGDDWLVHMK